LLKEIVEHLWGISSHF